MSRSSSRSAGKVALIVVAVILILIAVAVSSCFAEVPTGHTGVITTFGKVENYIFDEGIHFKMPWQKVVNMDNRAQKATIMTQAFSSDIQQVDITCSVNYSVDRETSQNLYREVGAYYYTTVMEPRIHENVKAVFAKYSAENLVASREILSDEIAQLLAPELKAYGIELINTSVEDIDFSDVFTNAVEQKQVAEQAKLQSAIEQEQKVREAQAEAERKVIAAEAEAEEKKIAADAEAYSIEIKAEAEAEANKKLAESITEELIAYIEANGWNGELPQFYGAEGMLPILDTTK